MLNKNKDAVCVFSPPQLQMALEGEKFNVERWDTGPQLLICVYKLQLQSCHMHMEQLCSYRCVYVCENQNYSKWI